MFSINFLHRYVALIGASPRSNIVCSHHVKWVLLTINLFFKLIMVYFRVRELSVSLDSRLHLLSFRSLWWGGSIVVSLIRVPCPFAEELTICVWMARNCLKFDIMVPGVPPWGLSMAHPRLRTLIRVLLLVTTKLVFLGFFPLEIT